MVRDAEHRKFSLLLTKEVSRFSRNILDTISYTRQLKQYGVGVLFMNDGIHTMDPDAELRLSIMASIAQEESRRTSSRVVWGQQRQMERGVVFGHALLGYTLKEGILTVEPHGAEVVRLIFHKYALEQLGTGDIAGFLMEKGYRTGSGNEKWSGSAVLKILKNEKYVGDLIQRKTYTPDYLTHEKKCNRGEVDYIVLKDHHEPIVSRELWNMTQRRIATRNRRRHIKEEKRSGKLLFSGKIRCSLCGRTFVPKYKYLKDGSKYRRWCCGCPVGRVIREDDGINVVKTAMEKLQMDRRELIDEVMDLVRDAVLSGGSEGKKALDRLRRELDRLQSCRQTAMDCRFRGEITGEEMGQMLRIYDEKVSVLQTRIWELEESCHRSWQEEGIRRCLEQVLTGEWLSESFARQILQELRVFPDRHLELSLFELPHIFMYDEKNMMEKQNATEG